MSRFVDVVAFRNCVSCGRFVAPHNNVKTGVSCLTAPGSYQTIGMQHGSAMRNMVI